MQYLAITSIIWAFSFGFIGNILTGIDSLLISTVRLGIAALIFLPILRLKSLSASNRVQLISCGSIQFGVMYICYIQAFKFLPSHLVALFSILTPLYVVIINDVRTKSWSVRYLFAAILSIIGAAVIKAKSGNSESFWTGFILMQIAGVSFAFGQIYYRDWKRQHPDIENYRIFGLLYIGGFSVALIFGLLCSDWSGIEINSRQWMVLIYLGLVASALGFFLWNKGATIVGSGTLAAFNNAVVPLAMLCSLFIFGEIKDISMNQILRLVIGSTFIFAAIYVAKCKSKRIVANHT
ncbi:MAG: EamA family transporter [Opitutaceae bacterium]